MHPAALTSPCGVQHHDPVAGGPLRTSMSQQRNDPAIILLAIGHGANEDSVACVRTSARASHLA
jgi:hypothetical protein